MALLKGIPSILPPELLKIMMEMGHGDELILADANFPAASHAQRLIRCDGHGVPVLLDAVLSLYPLDQYVAEPVGLMEVVPGDPVKPTIWNEYKEIIAMHESSAPNAFQFIERFEFYERAKKAYAIVATGESAQYANIILKKGCIIR